jgi:hypothetical protein
MTGTTASDDDTAAADLVVRALRAVADATPIDSAPINVDRPIAVMRGADMDRSILPRRRAGWLVGLTAAAAVALVVVAMWARVDGRVETSPSNEPPPDTAEPRPLAEEQVIARGEIDGRLWTLEAQPFENGIICLELTGGGAGCGSVPAEESRLGGVFQGSDNIEGSRFVYGAAVSEVAEVTAELANGEELSVDATQPAFGLRFYVIPIPPGPDAVAVTARDEDGVGLERVELAPQGWPSD